MPGLISSDNSEEEDGKGILIVRELPWRSERVTTFFEKSDAAHDATKFQQALRQSKTPLTNGLQSR